MSFGAGKTYLKKPGEEGFNKRSCPEVGEGKSVFVGLHKSAGPLEGPRGRGSRHLGITVDGKLLEVSLRVRP